MRLDKFVSHCTDLSRKDSRKAIKAGDVQVNSIVITDTSHQTSTDDVVSLVHQTLVLPKHRYFMVNKPVDVVSASNDAEHRCVTDLLGDQIPGLQVAGRLDIDTTGLTLLSDDGDWIHQVISPNKHLDKVYRVTVDKELPQATVGRFAEGLLLRGDSKPTRPALLELIDQQTYRATISEGRYHQVKRMFAACGAKVVNLHREQIGAICLDPDLPAGGYRELTAAEIDSVRSR